MIKTYRTNAYGAPILDTPDKRRLAKARMTRRVCPVCRAPRGSYCGEVGVVHFGRLDGGEAPVVEALEAAGYRITRNGRS